MRLRWWVVGLFISIAVGFLAPLASSSPDGLERIAEDHGFLEKAKDAPYGIIADYVFPWVGNEAAATILAGIVGTFVLFVLLMGIGSLLARGRRVTSV